MRNPERIEEFANILSRITNEDLTIMDIILDNDISYYMEDDETLNILSKYPKLDSYNIHANRLCYLWKLNFPDLRFGQLILNVISTPIDDSTLVSVLEKAYELKTNTLPNKETTEIFLENFTGI